MAKPKTQAVINSSNNEDYVLVVDTSGTKAAPGSSVVNWIISWGDGHTSNGTGPPPINSTHRYDWADTFNVGLTITDSKGTSSQDRKPMLVRGPIPINANPYGPQQSITCSGGITIPSGSTTASRQTLINANPGANFCIQSGIHTATGSNFPTSGQTFVANYGAVFDGTGWSSSDRDDGFFRALNNGVINVTIRNLEMKKSPSYGVNAYLTANTWLIEYCNMHHNLTGISVGKNSIVQYNQINNNIGTFNDPSAPLRGGGYNFNCAQGTQFLSNEISYNGQEQKAIYATVGSDLNTGYIVRNNWFHHNIENGWWIDGDGTGSIIEQNVFEDNGNDTSGGAGVVLEKGRQIIVQNNICRRNKSGIYLTVTRESQVLVNTLEDNNIAYDVFVDVNDVGTSLTGLSWTIDLISNVWTSGIVRVPSGASKFAVALGVINGDGTPWYTNTKNNNFDFNAYDVPIVGNAYWSWNGNKTFAQWQAIPEDPNGSQS